MVTVMTEALYDRPERHLDVSIEGVVIGRLADYGATWSFTYVPEWLAAQNAFALSPNLPLRAGEVFDGATFRAAQSFFGNLLPEEMQRNLMARDAGISATDNFGLLIYYGRETAGALTLMQDGDDRASAGRRPIVDDVLDARIRNLPRVSLADASHKKMSLAGAQHKLAIIRLESGEFLEPIGAEPSTHILKPDDPEGNFPFSVINEWFCMSLARACGLSAPAVYRHYLPSSAYVIERFDRFPRADGGIGRLYALDGCQALGLVKEDKYHVTPEGLRHLIDLSAVPAKTRTEIFNWVVFNCLIGNADCHYKNLSFLHAGDGKYTFAPTYDLLCVAAWDMGVDGGNRWPELSTLAWPIDGVTTFSGLSFASLVSFGAELGLKPNRAQAMVRTLVARVLPAAQQLQNDMLEDNRRLTTPEIGQALGGEARHVRLILAVIQEMTAKLRG